MPWRDGKETWGPCAHEQEGAQNNEHQHKPPRGSWAMGRAHGEGCQARYLAMCRRPNHLKPERQSHPRSYDTELDQHPCQLVAKYMDGTCDESLGMLGNGLLDWYEARKVPMPAAPWIKIGCNQLMPAT